MMKTCRPTSGICNARCWPRYVQGIRGLVHGVMYVYIQCLVVVVKGKSYTHGSDRGPLEEGIEEESTQFL